MDITEITLTIAEQLPGEVEIELDGDGALINSIVRDRGETVTARVFEEDGFTYLTGTHTLEESSSDYIEHPTIAPSLNTVNHFVHKLLHSEMRTYFA